MAGWDYAEMPVALMESKAPKSAIAQQDNIFADCLKRIADAQDREAFEILFEYFAARVKSFMLSKGLEDQLAEDLVQETMVLVWRKAALYHPQRGSVATWIYTIARNQRIDRLRRQGNVRFSDIDDFEAPSEDLLSDDVLNKSMEADLVRAALEKLPQNQAVILKMCFIDDMPQSEIAAKLDLPLGTVKSRMRLAYGKLRESLEQLR